MFDPKRILVLAPHTDDGELGCGGSVAKFRAEGRDVFYAAFSLCSKSLPQGLPADTLAHECLEATTQLGIESDKINLFNFEVRDFPKQRQDILEELVKLGKKITPDLVFIPSSTDIHQDHGVIHVEALRAFKNCSLLGYELPWNHAQFQSTFFIHLSEEHVKQKAEALKSYRSQSHRNYMDEDFILSLAKVRGVQSNTAYAEAFEVYKMISEE